MDLAKIASRLRPLDTSAVPDAQWSRITRRGKELQRMCSLKFDCAAFGISEVAKAVLCLALAGSEVGVKLERGPCIKASALSEKAYANSLRTLQNALGVRLPIDIRELGIQFGCVRVVDATRTNLHDFIQKFRASLPEERKGSADFSCPVYLVSAFYLTAKKHKLKVDRPKLLEVTSTTEEEMARVVALMQDLCPSAFGAGPHTPARADAAAGPGGRKRARESCGRENEDAGASGAGDEPRSGRGGGRGGESSGPRERGNRGEEGEGGEGGEGEKGGCGGQGDSSFEEWKERMRAQDAAQEKKKGSTGSGHERKLKQGKIVFRKS